MDPNNRTEADVERDKRALSALGLGGLTPGAVIFGVLRRRWAKWQAR